jgi:hypothetical protein
VELIPYECIEDFRIVILIYFVGGRKTLLVNTFGTGKKYGSYQQGMKVDSCFKNCPFLGHGQRDSILGS